MPIKDLLATEELQLKGAAVDNGRIVAQNDDPQVLVPLQPPLPLGWHRFEATIDCDESIEPKLFFDLGGGFSEVMSVRMKPSGPAKSYVATVKVPGPVACVRLDPMNFEGSFRLTRFAQQRLGLSELLFRLARFGAVVLRRDPLGFAKRLPVYLKALSGRHFLRLTDPAALRVSGGTSYSQWIARHDFDLARHGPRLRAALEGIDKPPLVSVLMPVYNTPERLLRLAIESVREQIYDNWQLCIADDCSTHPHIAKVLSYYASIDTRIKVIKRLENGHISEATNSAFELAEGDWIALLDHDDELRPHSLAEVVLEIERHPEAQLIYSDEDKLDDKGNRYGPYIKPDYSRELFRSQNYLNHLSVHRAENIRAVGGWRKGFEGSQDYDLNLRIIERIDPAGIRHIPKVLYHWRAVDGSTALAGQQKIYAYEAGFRALQQHVERLKLNATVEPAPDTPFYRLRFAVPERRPLVSLIIPTKDQVQFLRGCVESILEKTAYSPYEIVVVDNGSVAPEALAYLEALRQRENVRVLSWNHPFNYSAINNYAVSQASGEIVGLINNDIEVISRDWLSEMVSWAAQDDIGCVGAKLYYPNNKIQHAGVILGVGGVAGHSHKYSHRADPGYFGRLKILQNLSAVTGACLLVRKEVFLKVGGLNEDALKVAFNDVDLCLKVRRAGYSNVWTPYAEL